MRNLFTADRGSAITLAAILKKFKDGNRHTINRLSELCKEEGIGTKRQIREIMQCLKDMGCVSNHGRNGNKCHFHHEIHAGHIMSELYNRGIIS